MTWKNIEFNLWSFILRISCISFIIGPRGLGCEENLQETMWLESIGAALLDFRPFPSKLNVIIATYNTMYVTYDCFWDFEIGRQPIGKLVALFFELNLTLNLPFKV